MQLNPGEKMAIVRQLADPSDTGTYYVRATIRNARTDELLDTKDLTDRGGQRFSVEYQVPSKSSDAIYISISTRVYTDSGYATLSDMYGQEIDTYLVEIRQAHFGGGGSGISYKKIEEIVRAVLKDVEKEPETPTEETLRKVIAEEIAKIESTETNLVPVMDAIRGIDIQPKVSVKVDAPKIDMEMIALRLDEAVSKMINEKLSGSALQTITDSLVAAAEKKMVELMTSSVNESAQSIRESVKKIEEGMVKDIIASTVGAMRKNDEPIPSPFQGMSTGELIKEALRKKK